MAGKDLEYQREVSKFSFLSFWFSCVHMCRLNYVGTFALANPAL